MMKMNFLYFLLPIYFLIWLIIYIFVGLRIYQRWIRQEIIYLIQMIKVTIDVYQKKNSEKKNDQLLSAGMQIEQSMNLELETESEENQNSDMETKKKLNDGEAYLNWERVEI